MIAEAALPERNRRLRAPGFSFAANAVDNRSNGLPRGAYERALTHVVRFRNRAIRSAGRMRDNRPSLHSTVSAGPCQV